MKRITLFLGVVLLIAGTANADFDFAHEKAQHKERRVIFNNDADDTIYTTGGATPASLWAVRGAPIVGSQVDTMYYGVNTGIGMFRVPTPFGTLLSKKYLDDYHNITNELVAQGTDPLRVMIEFSAHHDIELFATFRMNDIHDGVNPDWTAKFLSSWKKSHPDWLHGTEENKPPFGYWSGADYGEEEVRDYVFTMVEYICTNYDIDGIELDFWRHPPHFTSCAWGERAAVEQQTLMTELMRRIRTMTHRVAQERGRPLLISVRMLESLEISLGQGLDIATWLEEDLFDLLVTGEFAQDKWAELIALGNAYNVPVYPGLRRNFRKGGGYLESLRGQALTAHRLGADGVYLFNLFPETLQSVHGSLEPFFTYGSPDTVANVDKLYSFTRDDGIIKSYLAHGIDSLHEPARDLKEPISLGPNQQRWLPIAIWDRPATSEAPPVVRLRATFKNAADAALVAITVNGTAAEIRPEDASSEHQFYTSTFAALKENNNLIGLRNMSDQEIAFFDLRIYIDYSE